MKAKNRQLIIDAMAHIEEAGMLLQEVYEPADNDCLIARSMDSDLHEIYNRLDKIQKGGF